MFCCLPCIGGPTRLWLSRWLFLPLSHGHGHNVDHDSATKLQQSLFISCLHRLLCCSPWSPSNCAGVYDRRVNSTSRTGRRRPMDSRWGTVDVDVLSHVLQRLLPFPGQVGQCRLVSRGWKEAIARAQEVTVTLQHGTRRLRSCRI